MVYLDDLIIFSATREEHQAHIETVFKLLDKVNLRISLKKCQFFEKEVRFLGFLVSGEGIRPDPRKTDAIKNWPRPTTEKELQQFLGFCAFYHRFISNLSKTATPLYRLLKKDTAYEWSAEAQKSFDDLRAKVIKLPTLAYPNPQSPFDLHTDASDMGLGAVLVQNGRPVAFASRTLTSAEKNYSTTEKECLAIVWALQYFYPYVYGATFTIYTD